MRTGIVSAALALIIGLILLAGKNVVGGPNAFVVIGVVNGAVFGLVALGLVIVYKGTRVFNFAQGEFGTMAAYMLFLGIANDRMPYGLAAVVAVIGTVVLGVMLERIFIKPLMNAPRVTLLVATIALALLAIGAEILLFEAEPRELQPALAGVGPDGTLRGISVFEQQITPQNLLAIGTLLGLAVLLGYFFSRTNLGLAVLATSQDAFATRVVGIGIQRMSMFIWGSAAFLGAVAGILYVPTVGFLSPGVMTSNILIPAFTGAVIGGMTSLPGAFIGGVVIGLVQSLALWAGGHFTFGTDPLTGAPKILGEIVPGVEQVAIILVLLIVLLARPQGLLGREA